VACTFCEIASGNIPASIVAETSNFIAFRDINPISPTHILVVPKRHLESPAELASFSGEAIRELFSLLDEVADREGIKETGYRIVMNIGDDAKQEVLHLHFHLLGGRRLGSIG
jgi:histidine triad (HIT) family protein